MEIAKTPCGSSRRSKRNAECQAANAKRRINVRFTTELSDEGSLFALHFIWHSTLPDMPLDLPKLRKLVALDENDPLSRFALGKEAVRNSGG